MDFAISNGGDNTVYIYLGNGDGTFQTPEVLFTQGQSPVSITTASLRNNGHLDLILADADSGQVETFLGNGDGTFLRGTAVDVGPMPTFVTTGDFNKDGHVDIVVGLTEYLQLQPLFEVLEGDGKGNFPTGITGPGYQPPSGLDWEAPVPASSIAVGDLNNDGFPDVVVSLGVLETGISYLNQGGNNFSTISTFSPADGLVTATLADMDGDGCLDAVQATAGGFITIAKGTCDGNFQEQGPSGVAGEVDDTLQILDVNGDGKLDVIGSSSAEFDGELTVLGLAGDLWGGYHVTVMKGDGKGDLSNAVTYVVPQRSLALVAADLRSTGYPDIVALTDGSGANGTATTLLNDGTGAYGNPQGSSEEIYPEPGPVPVDLNGDGKTDVLALQVDPNYYLTSLLSDGTGKLSAPIRTQLPNTLYASNIYTGDFRHVGKQDALLASSYNGSLTYLSGNGDGSFGTPVSLPAAGATIAVGDLNNDGKLDFAAIGKTLDIFLGNGDGTFNHLAASLSMPSLQTTEPAQLFIGDFNHDGKMDLLAGYEGNAGSVASGDDLYLFAGNGDGTFQSPTLLFSHFGPAAVADLNHDGYLDLIQARDPANNIGLSQVNSSAESIPAAVTVYLGQPNGTYKPTTYPLPGTLDDFLYSSPVTIGDINGDGIPDIAIRFFSANYDLVPSIAILQGLGNGSFAVIPNSQHAVTLNEPIILSTFLGGPATDMLVYALAAPSIDIIPAAPAPPLNIAFQSSPMVTTSGTAVVTLTLPTTSAETVSLSSSDPAITMPASVSFNTGEQQQRFNFTLNQGYDSTHLLALSAIDPSGYTATAFVQKPNPSTTATVTLAVDDPNGLLLNGELSIVPGQISTFDLHWMSKGGYQGTFALCVQGTSEITAVHVAAHFERTQR